MSRSKETEKLVVVIASETFPPDINGAAKFTENLAVGLAARGHEIHVIAPSTSKRYGTYREVHRGVPLIVHRLKSYRIPQHASLRWASPFGLRKQSDNLLSRIKPDVVHIQTHMLVGRFVMNAAIRQGIRLIATNHTMPENLIRYSVIIPRFAEKLAMKIWWKDTAKALAKADLVTTPTRLAANILESNTGLTGVLAISCGIDAKAYASAPEVSNDDPTALFVGRLDFEKQIHILIEALSKLPNDLGRLEIVGDGAERESLGEWASELGVSNRVKFLGHVSDRGLKDAIARSTVFVMPSIAELQSIATMEAMASGRPVIGANAAALPHLIHDGENGFLFEPGDVDALTAALFRVFTAKPAELKSWARNSLHLISAHDIDTTLDRFESIYRNEADLVSETLDNQRSYSLPIVNSDAVKAGVEALRKSARNLQERAEEIRDGVLERLSDVRGEVVERFEEVGYEVLNRSRKTGRKLRRAVRKALGRFRRHDR
jgi:glycosyltransferase involved in cell wall biosynthesis